MVNVRVQDPPLVSTCGIAEPDVGAAEGEERERLVDSPIHAALGQCLGYSSTKFSILANGL